MTSTRYQLNMKPVNYCVPGMLSKCGAGKTWLEHRLCRFAIKSDFVNKCMYYNGFMDEHCDCLDAQRDALTIVDE
ncbi:MAG: hypothetical protein JSW26_26585 [Desulfobacterales bacterium]|nr:MAG: hypothetical protein JSW26_26585 [Desulfobacterales bacterium]